MCDMTASCDLQLAGDKDISLTLLCCCASLWLILTALIGAEGQTLGTRRFRLILRCKLGRGFGLQL